MAHRKKLGRFPRREDAVRDQDMEVRMNLEASPKRLGGHDDARQSPAGCRFTANHLFRHPSAQQAVNESGGLAVEAGVLLEAFPQAHLSGKGDDDVSVGHLRQLLAQQMAQVFCPPIGTRWAGALLARKRDGEVDLAIGAVK